MVVGVEMVVRFAALLGLISIVGGILTWFVNILGNLGLIGTI